MYHGLGDQLIATTSSIYCSEHVRDIMSAQGVNVNDFYCLFLVPGMHHCYFSKTAPWYIAGANEVPHMCGADYSVPGYEDAQHDVLLALVQWVEHGMAPDSLIATRFRQDDVDHGVERQRPLCDYPAQARYLRTRNPDLARHWACENSD